MSKFLIKESSIKDGVNERYFNALKQDLSKIVKGLIFNASQYGGNYACWETE